jgi:hypothetical protein
VTPEEKQAFAELVAIKVREGCPGACGLSAEGRRKLGHVVGVIKDHGDGDYDKGAEILRDALRVIKSIDVNVLNSMVGVFKGMDRAAVYFVRTLYAVVVLAMIKLFFKAMGIGLMDLLKRII